MASRKIADIEGIGPKYAELLTRAGVRTVHGLLKKGATGKGRNEIAKTTGIDTSMILKWVNFSDLYRIKGVGSEYSELLEKAGVDTIKELRNRNAENLFARMKELNAEKKLVRQLPGLKQVQSWINEAKKLNPIIEY